MPGGVDFRLNTTEKDARWMQGSALQESLILDPQDVRAIVEDSMQPGLQALRRNVGQVGTVTGRLRRAPAVLTRKYGRQPRFRILGLLGYRNGIAPHARFLELGTPPRAGRGLVKARRMAWSAFFLNRKQMLNTVKARLEALVAKSLSRMA
jgi:hypothetical protein